MTTRQNRIILPNRYNVKVVIHMNATNGQTELKVEQGQLTHIQVLGLLLEHATAMFRGMVSTTQKPLMMSNDSIDGGSNDAA